MINAVKQGSADVSWTLILCFQGVTQEWISSVFEMSDVFWIAELSLFSSWDDIIVCDKLVVYDVWFSEDDNTGFLSVGVDIFVDFYHIILFIIYLVYSTHWRHGQGYW